MHLNNTQIFFYETENGGGRKSGWRHSDRHAGM